MVKSSLSVSNWEKMLLYKYSYFLSFSRGAGMCINFGKVSSGVHEKESFFLLFFFIRTMSHLRPLCEDYTPLSFYRPNTIVDLDTVYMYTQFFI